MAVISPVSVGIKYGYDANVNAKNVYCYSSDGFYFTLTNLLSSAKDFAINQDNLLVLTDKIGRAHV